MDEPHQIGPNTNFPETNFGGGGGANFVNPYKIGTGTLRGVQRVGFGSVKIDGANNRIVLNSSSNFNSPLNIETTLGKLSDNTGDQSFGFKVSDINGNTLTLGVLNDGTLGMEMTDASGFVLFRLSSAQSAFNFDWFDKNYNTNTMRAGKLPDGNYGWVATPPANNVNSAFGS